MTTESREDWFPSEYERISRVEAERRSHQDVTTAPIVVFFCLASAAGILFVIVQFVKWAWYF